MIAHSITYNRDFRRDFPNTDRGDHLLQKVKRVAQATLPLLSLHRPFRRPLSLGLDCLQTISHLRLMKEAVKNRDLRAFGCEFFQTSLSAGAVALFFIAPAAGMVAGSFRDLVLNAWECKEHLQNHNYKEAGIAFAHAALDLLFISSIAYGSIEFTVGCLVLQILVEAYHSLDHFKKGNFLEGVCQAIMAGAHTRQAIPQARVMQWMWKHKPEFTATLKQDKKGFVYLDIPDEHIEELFALLKESGAELPPYFGPGRAGGHVSVILKDEWLKNGQFNVEEVGKKYTFRIHGMDSVKPDGWSGVDKVWYLTLASKDLENLRASHGLSPKQAGHDFHITFGIQREQAEKSLWNQIQNLFPSRL